MRRGPPRGGGSQAGTSTGDGGIPTPSAGYGCGLLEGSLGSSACETVRTLRFFDAEDGVSPALYCAVIESHSQRAKCGCSLTPGLATRAEHNDQRGPLPLRVVTTVTLARPLALPALTLRAETRPGRGRPSVMPPAFCPARGVLPPSSTPAPGRAPGTHPRGGHSCRRSAETSPCPPRAAAGSGGEVGLNLHPVAGGHTSPLRGTRAGPQPRSWATVRTIHLQGYVSPIRGGFPASHQFRGHGAA